MGFEFSMGAKNSGRSTEMPICSQIPMYFLTLCSVEDSWVLSGWVRCLGSFPSSGPRRFGIFDLVRAFAEVPSSQQSDASQQVPISFARAAGEVFLVKWICGSSVTVFQKWDCSGRQSRVVTRPDFMSALSAGTLKQASSQRSGAAMIIPFASLIEIIGLPWVRMIFWCACNQVNRALEFLGSEI